jgi:hypothetical protein
MLSNQPIPGTNSHNAPWMTSDRANGDWRGKRNAVRRRKGQERSISCRAVCGAILFGMVALFPGSLDKALGEVQGIDAVAEEVEGEPTEIVRDEAGLGEGAAGVLIKMEAAVGDAPPDA